MNESPALPPERSLLVINQNSGPIPNHDNSMSEMLKEQSSIRD